MPKKRALIGHRRKRSDSARGTPDSRTAANSGNPRKKLPLDPLLNLNVQELLSGYPSEELSELQEKISELGGEILDVLDYDVEVEEILGIKLDGDSLWFFVRWEDGENSFIPAKILNKIAPGKVIKFYESRLQFSAGPPPGVKKEENFPAGIGMENLQKRIPPGGDIIDKLPSRILAEEQQQNSVGNANNSNSAPPPPLKKQKISNSEPFINHTQTPPPPTPPTPTSNSGPISQKNPQKNFRTMNCTGCMILLQYPEGTKAIKCPACNTVMQAR